MKSEFCKLTLVILCLGLGHLLWRKCTALPPPVQLSWQQVESSARPFTLVDARPAEEYSQGHIPGASNLPISQAMELRQANQPLLGELPTSQPVLVYCDGPDCGASERLAAWLRQQGYRQVYVLQGGYPAWQLKRPGKP